MTNLTPAQLEQFESTFRYFDRDETNTLSQSEMTAALASLGIVYSDEDMDYIYDQLLQDYGAVSFEAFINLLVDITEDQTSAEQLREAFRGIAADKVQHSLHPFLIPDSLCPQPFVTELDLRVAHLPVSAIGYLREVMPSVTNDMGEPEYDYGAWLDGTFG
jgi:hypothetical protein